MLIKKKLIISNIAMVLIPMLFVWVLSLISTEVFYNYRNSSEFLNEFNITNRLMDIASDSKKAAEVNRLCEQLEGNGLFLQLIVDDNPIYISGKYEAIKTEISGNIQDFGHVRQYVYSSDNASEIYQERAVNNHTVSLHLLKGGQLAIDMGREDFVRQGEFLRKMMLVIFILAVAVIILTNAFLTSFISKSILKPLKILHEGTNQIKQGNLDYEVKYTQKDEFGAVCGDFEEMRTRLKESVAEQVKYEESRKELIAGISHDLATPLTHIKGYVSGILDGVANTPEKTKDYLMTINNTADSMKKMVNNLFLFSKLDINRVPFNFNTVDLVDYIKNYCQEIKGDLDQRNMDIVFYTDSKHAFVSLDTMQFERILFNIIDNSVKYKKGSRGRIMITLSDEADNIQLSIKDDGRGVAKEDVSKIFNIFYRTDRARGETEKGSGLGLAIVRQIINFHGGKVWADADLKEGLKIIVSLPKYKEV